MPLRPPALMSEASTNLSGTSVRPVFGQAKKKMKLTSMFQVVQRCQWRGVGLSAHGPLAPPDIARLAWGKGLPAYVTQRHQSPKEAQRPAGAERASGNLLGE